LQANLESARHVVAENYVSRVARARTIEAAVVEKPAEEDDHGHGHHHHR